MIPETVLARYDIAETRNAAAIMKATTPTAFVQMVEVLESFELTVDKLTRPGKNKSVVAAELDGAFRRFGWREARYDQQLTTQLSIFPWPGAAEVEQKEVIETKNAYGGHKIDNVLGRAALDVEWNPKDGNLDRDLGNYVSLHEGGIIDVGVLLTRRGEGLRDLVRDLVAEVKNAPARDNAEWRERMDKLPDNPYGTTTTATFDKLVPRLERGDGRGCPILAIGIGERTFTPPTDSVTEEVWRLSGAGFAADD